ncbi:MAG: Regulator of sigma-E protease RseP [Planctomycetota bacterium]|jgi:regulator of sigma E protease
MDLGFLAFAALAALGFGFVIFIHELGHFLFAKWAGVRVLRFSIGFGPVLLRWTRGETEYALSLLPLGGYVQMHGEEVIDGKTGGGAPEPGSFNAASYSWRAWILLGGVLFNLLSSWLILLGLAFWGMPLMRPVVGEVESTVAGQRSPATALGLRAGDEITAINGGSVRSFEDVMMSTVFAGGRPVTVDVVRDGRPLSLPASGSVLPVYDPALGRSTLGIVPPYSTLVRAVIRPDGEPGTAADPVRVGDRIVGMDGERFPVARDGLPAVTWQDVAYRLQARPEGKVRLLLAGPDGEREADISLGQDTGRSVGLPIRLAAVLPGTPAERAGLRAGDVVVSADGEPVLGDTGLHRPLRQAFARGGTVALVVARDGATRAVAVAPADVSGRVRMGAELQPLSSGVLPAVGGALAAAGVAPGDLLIGVTVDRVSGTVAVRTATGARLRLEPLADTPAEAERLARVLARAVPAPAVLRWFRVPGRPAPLELFAAGAVMDPVKDGEGLPPAAVRIRADDGLTTVVDLAGLGLAGPPLARRLVPGDRVLGVQPTASGPALLVASGLSAVRRLDLPLRGDGYGLAFGTEETPYRMHSPWEAGDIILDASHHMIVKSLTMVPRFFKAPEDGGIDPNKSLSGPVGIFQALKVKAETTGFDGFLRMVALIGLNLVLVNLLPIPVTDGGQLLFLALEKVRGRPLSPGSRRIAAIIGTVIVLALMAYVLGLDLLRLVGLI